MERSRCLRHPYIETDCRCRRCGTPLCSDCRLQGETIFYCSAWCLRLDALHRRFLATSPPTVQDDPFAAERRLARRIDGLLILLLVFVSVPLLVHPRGVPLPPVEARLVPPPPSPSPAVAPLPEPLPPKKIVPIRKAAPSEKEGRRTAVSPPLSPTTEKKGGALAASISRVEGAGRQLSITFDGGSSDSAAEEILDVLLLRGVRTTFFLTGRFIERYPDLTRRIVREGHEVGNHTLNHPHLTTFWRDRRQRTSDGVDDALLKRELEETARLFKETTGEEMAPLWRAPYGEMNGEILKWAAEAGYRHIAWTVDYKARQTMDSLDWVWDPASPLYGTADAVKERLLSFADEKERARGGIILMHLGTERKRESVHEVLGELIDGFAEKGYEVVPVSRLIALKEATK